jgi:hypothetical protein
MSEDAYMMIINNAHVLIVEGSEEVKYDVNHEESIHYLI